LETIFAGFLQAVETIFVRKERHNPEADESIKLMDTRIAMETCDLQCKIEETLLIRDLKPARAENGGRENSFIISHRM